MKVLIDPIYTNDPDKCSCCFKMQSLVKHVLSQRDDVFFYFLIPEKKEGSMGTWDVDESWFFNHPNVEYIKIPTDSDRMKEYWMLSPELEDCVAFNGKLWDFDLLITARHMMVPIIKAWLGRNGLTHLKKVVIEDEFPVMTFKPRALTPYSEDQDFHAINCYYQADRTYIFSFYSKKHMMAAAKKFLSPSIYRALDEKIVQVSSVEINTFELKSKKYIKSVASHEKDFVLSSPVRIGNPSFYWPVLDVFEKQWIRHGGKKIKFMLTQNTRHVESINAKYKFLKAIRCKREQFWDMMRNEVDVIMCMHPDLDYPLSLIEPLYLGVPAIIQRAQYTDETFGADYPFYANNVKEAYALTKAFYDDYEGMYAKFAKWHTESWVPLLKSRNALWFPLLFMKDLKAHEEHLAEYVGRKTKENEIVKLVMEEVGKKKEFVLDDIIQKLIDKKKLNSMAQVFKKERRMIPVAMATDYNLLRLRIIYDHGFKDASVKRGHFKKQ